MTLVFDTETTGKADFRSPPEANHQPRIVQIGAMLFDDSWKVRSELNLILLPPDIPIPPEVSSIHGITNEVALKFGVERRSALNLFASLMARADLLVAHNLDFDSHVLCGEFIRNDVAGVIKWGVCTMHEMTPVCKIPNINGYSDYKWPRLEEAYRFAFNETFDGAHDAMADVRACARIYRWLKDRQPVASV